MFRVGFPRAEITCSHLLSLWAHLAGINSVHYENQVQVTNISSYTNKPDTGKDKNNIFN